MIRRIVLDNFMSHRHAVIEPADGLTVLAGPNNCGKSAVVEALRTLCGNARGDYMVRHGEKECRVTVETDDGHAIVWRRKGEAVSYAIDGRDIHRVGGAVPEDLHGFLRLPKVVAPEGDDEFDIHFAEQKSPIFLLDKSGRQRALFFASSSDAALLMEMQRRHRQKVVDAKREELRLTAATETIRALIGSLGPVAAMDERLALAEHDFETLSRECDAMASLARDADALARQAREAVRAEDRCRALAGLPVPPELADTAPLDASIGELSMAGAAAEREGSRCAALSNLVPPPALEDTAPIEAAIEDLGRAARTAALEGSRREVLSPLAAPPPIEDTEPIERLCRELAGRTRAVAAAVERAGALKEIREPPVVEAVGPLEQLCAALERQRGAIEGLRAAAERLADLDAPPELADPSPLAELIGKFESVANQARWHDGETVRIRREMQEASDAIREWAAANPVCPTCGATLDAERLIAAGGEHEHG